MFSEQHSVELCNVFQSPLELNGQWEFGTESVPYSSQIDYAKERAEIHCHAQSDDIVNADRTYPFELIPSSDGTWKGYKDMTLNTFEKNPHQVENIVAILNILNEKY